MLRRILVVLVVLVMSLTTVVGVHAQSYGTGVYVNGRELASSELIQLENLLGYVPPGYYWLDRYCNFGRVGYPNSINLCQFEVPSPSADPLPVVQGIPGPNGDGSYGPFATIRRANEVVNMFRRMGYPNTIQYHNGDGQYVFPRR